MCVKTLNALLLARQLALNEILMPVDRQYKLLKKYRKVNCPGSLVAWCIGNSESWARVQVNLAEAVDHTKQLFGILQRRAKVKTLSVGPDFR